jgi:pimeloyl-ACP methyl ester carboxylesterase
MHTADLVPAPPVTPGRPITLVVAGSLVVGFVLAVLFVIGPASGATESVVAGSVLVAFGIGWLLLGALSIRFTHRPQRWAFVPAAAMGLVGLGLVVFAPRAPTMGVLSWLWPPALLILAVWIVVQVRRDLPGRVRWLVYPVVFVLGSLAIGGAFETLSEARDSATYPITGQAVDVGGRNVHIECAGTGEPTVVFESGLGEGSPYWGRIAPAVSATARVCVYDRAGRGGSDDAGAPQDGIAVARDLHTLLANAGIAGPVVLVGHSTGGPYVRVFAAQYPDEVAGMVLLDSQPADAFTALPTFPSTYSTIRLETGVLPSVARIGVYRVIVALVSADLPAPYGDIERAQQSTPLLLSGQRDEFAVLPATLAQAAALTSLGDKPLVVVSATVDTQQGWHEAQDAMVSLSSNSDHRLAPGQTHGSLIVSEEGAAISAQAIRDVIESVRTGAALTN